MVENNYDVIVVGGGHAGCEASASSARSGSKTLLVTHKFSTIGEMSCNPAIGGLGKGHLVREIDALGGVMSIAIDQAGIQYRVLNKSKGVAVQGIRAQADRDLYKNAVQDILSNYENLDILESSVDDLIIDETSTNDTSTNGTSLNDTSTNGISTKQVTGIILKGGGKIHAKSVIITAGTFLRGEIHMGKKITPAGRMGDEPSISLAKTLESLGLPVARLKTGTPARLKKDSINWDVLDEQKGDEEITPFSFLTNKITTPQISCYITYTNEKSHKIIQDNLHQAGVYTGQIKGIGPRYCPSIEDKITRFADKDRHQIFLEPEGLNSNLIYPNGMSTSLPEDVQDQFFKTIKGLENVEIETYGYAIEYDFFDPQCLRKTLETSAVKNLFFAGQINGSTGYEEAAAQGLWAGVNASLKAQKSEKIFVLDRASSYMGVMVDDLILKGTKEPYRMFTSRAEYRLLLRSDNADQRLTEIGNKYNLISQKRLELYLEKKEKISQARNLTKSLNATPNQLQKFNINVKLDGVRRSAFELLSYNGVTIDSLKNMWQELNNIDKKTLEQIEIEGKYAGYLERQIRDVERFRKEENHKIPQNFNYKIVSGLSNEIVSKLEKIRPTTLGEAGRISGVTPASLTLLLAYLKKR